MIHKQTFDFLRDIKNNNSKEWMDENRENYQLAKENILEVAELLIANISKFDGNISALHLDPKKCITRLNRDLRFSKDKTPYKTDYYIVLNKDGKNSASAFYYLHIEPGNNFVGGGVYNPQPKELKKIREEIDYSFKEWQDIINDEKFRTSFPDGIQNSGMLKNIPRGFEDENPAKTFLRMKGFYTQKNLTDKELQEKETLEKIVDCFISSKPLIDFLNRAIAFD